MDHLSGTSVTSGVTTDVIRDPTPTNPRLVDICRCLYSLTMSHPHLFTAEQRSFIHLYQNQYFIKHDKHNNKVMRDLYELDNRFHFERARTRWWAKELGLPIPAWATDPPLADTTVVWVAK